MADSPTMLSFACAQCGTQTTRTYRGSGVKPTLCGNACKVAAYKARHPDRVEQNRERERIAGPSRVTAERMVYRRWATRQRTGYAERLAYLRDKISRKRAHSSSPCRMCGCAVGYDGNGRRRLYCSVACAHRSEPFLIGKRATKARRRAIERGTEAERFDPFEVFERDGWRCHLCGVNTPKRLRGTYQDRAPELDHIIPLAKGGKHTRINTACSCRRCNGEKGAEARGQLRLVV